jgi:hypothetical protein
MSRHWLLFAICSTVIYAACSEALAVYNADLGRWITRDPIGYVDGASLITFVTDSPVVGQDPEGLQCVPACPPGEQCQCDVASGLCWCGAADGNGNSGKGDKCPPAVVKKRCTTATFVSCEIGRCQIISRSGNCSRYNDDELISSCKAKRCDVLERRGGSSPTGIKPPKGGAWNQGCMDVHCKCHYWYTEIPGACQGPEIAGHTHNCQFGDCRVSIWCDSVEVCWARTVGECYDAAGPPPTDPPIQP